jgi:hypothetical protein
MPFFAIKVRSGAAKPELEAQIQRLVTYGRVLALAPHTGEVTIWIENDVPLGATLHQAHGWWNAAAIDQPQTPEGLPRQLPHRLAPDGVVRIVVEFVERKSGGMSSLYGFEGYFLSLIVNPVEQTIWDARGEPAT